MLFILKDMGLHAGWGDSNLRHALNSPVNPVADRLPPGLAWGLQITLIRVRRRHFSHNEVGLCITTFGPL